MVAVGKPGERFGDRSRVASVKGLVLPGGIDGDGFPSGAWVEGFSVGGSVGCVGMGLGETVELFAVGQGDGSGCRTSPVFEGVAGEAEGLPAPGGRFRL